MSRALARSATACVRVALVCVLVIDIGGAAAASAPVRCVATALAPTLLAAHVLLLRWRRGWLNAIYAYGVLAFLVAAAFGGTLLAAAESAGHGEADDGSDGGSASVLPALLLLLLGDCALALAFSAPTLPRVLPGGSVDLYGRAVREASKVHAAAWRATAVPARFWWRGGPFLCAFAVGAIALVAGIADPTDRHRAAACACLAVAHALVLQRAFARVGYLAPRITAEGLLRTSRERRRLAAWVWAGPASPGSTKAADGGGAMDREALLEAEAGVGGSVDACDVRMGSGLGGGNSGVGGAGAQASTPGARRERLRRIEAMIASSMVAEGRLWQWGAVCGVAALCAAWVAAAAPLLVAPEDGDEGGGGGGAVLRALGAALAWSGLVAIAVSVPSAPLPGHGAPVGLEDASVCPLPTTGSSQRVLLILPAGQGRYDAAEAAICWYLLTRRGHSVVFATPSGAVREAAWSHKGPSAAGATLRGHVLLCGGGGGCFLGAFCCCWPSRRRQQQQKRFRAHSRVGNDEGSGGGGCWAEDVALSSLPPAPPPAVLAGVVPTAPPRVIRRGAPPPPIAPTSPPPGCITRAWRSCVRELAPSLWECSPLGACGPLTAAIYHDMRDTAAFKNPIAWEGAMWGERDAGGLGSSSISADSSGDSSGDAEALFSSSVATDTSGSSSTSSSSSTPFDGLIVIGAVAASGHDGDGDVNNPSASGRGRGGFCCCCRRSNRGDGEGDEDGVNEDAWWVQDAALQALVGSFLTSGRPVGAFSSALALLAACKDHAGVPLLRGRRAAAPSREQEVALATLTSIARCSVLPVRRVFAAAKGRTNTVDAVAYACGSRDLVLVSSQALRLGKDRVDSNDGSSSRDVMGRASSPQRRSAGSKAVGRASRLPSHGGRSRGSGGGGGGWLPHLINWLGDSVVTLPGLRPALPGAPDTDACVCEDGALLSAQCGGDAWVLAGLFVSKLELLAQKW